MKNNISNKDLGYLSRLSKIKISKKETVDLKEILQKEAIIPKAAAGYSIKKAI